MYFFNQILTDFLGFPCKPLTKKTKEIRKDLVEKNTFECCRPSPSAGGAHITHVLCHLAHFDGVLMGVVDDGGGPP